MTSERGDARLMLPEDFRLQTNNLDIIPGDDELVSTDWNDHARLSKALKAHVPEAWPPQLVPDDSSPNGEGWREWYVLQRKGDQSVLIGMVGVKGWPEVSRSVKVGCAFLPEFQRQRFGTEAVDAITSWALRQPGIEQVTADTPAGNRGAIGILRNLGFSQVDSDELSLLRFKKTASK